MLRLLFSGWCQVRLATDPDPFDEPAGASGRTVALAGEEPLDRVVRFQRAVDPRLGAPEVGVRVDEVWDGARHVPLHPLEQARVDLLEGPVFEGRNGLVADDGYEPIHPFVLRIETDGGIALQREDPPATPWNPARPDPAALAHRFGSGLDESAAAEIGQAVGAKDPAKWHAARQSLLQRARNEAPPGPERVGLDLRLAMLEPVALVRVRYRFLIGRHGGQGLVDDPEERLARRVDPSAPWPIDLWFGGWDGDGLVAFVKGELRLPLKP